MEDQNGLDQLGLHFEEHNAALSAILNNRVDDAEAVLSVLSPAQLKQLELNVKNMKRNRGSGPSSAGTSKSHKDHHASSLAGMSSITNQHLMHDYATTLPHPSLSAHDDHSLLLHNHHSLLDMSQHLQDPQLNSSLSSSALILSPTGSHLSPHHSHHHSTNLPASCPILEIRDGTEYLMFTYSTKGQQQEFAIKTEIECISVEEIPDDFKAENCVYPRAFCRREQYVGNRWEYETACNDLAWKLTWINSEILSGKRGLIQRAVDSYRNRLTEMRSRRVIRQEKLSNGTLRRRATESSDAEAIYQHQMALAASPNAPPFFLPQGHLPSAEKHHSYGGSGRKSAKKMTVPYPTKEGQVAKISFFINIDSVGPEDEDDIFKMENCIYPDTWGPEVGDARREYEMECNDIAWKLAHLNKQTLAGKKYLLQKAVDYYREMSDSENISSRSTHKSRPGRKPKQTPHPLQDTTNFSYSHQDHSHNPYLSGQMPLGMGMGGVDFESQKQEEFSAIVANTLQQALSHHDLSGHDLSSVVGDLELNGHTDASSLYESFHPHLYDSGNNGFYH